MSVTELATVHFQPQFPPNLTSILTIIQKAKSFQERVSGFPAYYFQDILEPSRLYIIGTWESKAKHEAIYPSKGNQELLQLLMPFCVEKSPISVIHVDFELRGKEGIGSIDGDGVEVLIYSGIDTKEKDRVTGEIARVKGRLEKHEVFCGWSVEEEEKYVSIIAVHAGLLEGNLESKISRSPFEDHQYDVGKVFWFHAKLLSV